MSIFDLPPDPPTDLEGPPMPALASGTSTEFLNLKSLPRAIQERAMVFVLGPQGVGKSFVARAMAGIEGQYLSEDDVLAAVKVQTRKRQWADDLVQHPALVLESPCFLNRRPAVLRSLQDLLRLRAGQGRRTWVCEAESGSNVERLMEAIHPGYRATLVLRFPVGLGRKRFASKMCSELGVDDEYAKETLKLDPWSYTAVIEFLQSR